MQQMVTDTDTTNRPMCREQENRRLWSIHLLTDTSLSHSVLARLRICCGAEDRETIRSAKTEVSMFLSYHSTGFHRVCLRRRNSLFFFRFCQLGEDSG